MVQPDSPLCDAATIEEAETELDQRDVGTLWDRVRSRTEQSLEVIEIQANHLLDRELTEAERSTALRSASSLAAGLGRLQIPEVARLARELHQTLKSQVLHATTGVQLAGTIEDLREMLETVIAQRQQPLSADGPVLAIGAPTEEFDIILWVLAGRGLAVRHETRALPDDADLVPSAILVTIGHDIDGPTKPLLRAALETYDVPFVALHHDAPQSTLVNLAAICTTVVPSSTAPDVVAGELLRIRAARNSDRRALILGSVDGEATLGAHGFERTRLERGVELLDAVASVSAVLFGPGVPSGEKFRLSRLIRSQPATRQVSIVWLGEGSAKQQTRAARLDVLIADDIDDVLAARLVAQAQASARDIGDDSLESGNTLTWVEASVLIDRMLVGAHRSNGAASVATIELDKAVVPHQVDRIRQLLGREFRREDVVASRGERSFVVALQGVDRRVATSRMSRLVNRLDLGASDVNVGIAEFPLDGRSSEELVLNAEKTSARAASSGGPQVASSEWRPFAESAPDVLIVDPDVTVGEMLSASLERTGLSVEHLANGREALERLSSRDLAELPRLLLLDLDPEGLSGLDLLRSLQPTGVLAHMEILLMTSTSAESSARAGLDFGASDVIEKPVSTTLLLNRVALMLGT